MSVTVIDNFAFHSWVDDLRRVLGADSRGAFEVYSPEHEYVVEAYTQGVDVEAAASYLLHMYFDGKAIDSSTAICTPWVPMARHAS